MRCDPVSSGIQSPLRLPLRDPGLEIVSSPEDVDRSEAAEYFNIAGNFQRVAIFGGGLATRDAVLDEETIRRDLAIARCSRCAGVIADPPFTGPLTPQEGTSNPANTHNIAGGVMFLTERSLSFDSCTGRVARY